MRPRWCGSTSSSGSSPCELAWDTAPAARSYLIALIMHRPCTMRLITAAVARQTRLSIRWLHARIDRRPHNQSNHAWMRIIAPASRNGRLSCWVVYIMQPGQHRIPIINSLLLYLLNVSFALTLWRPQLPYRYSYKASCARPG